jgi:hypothetical protein
MIDQHERVRASFTCVRCEGSKDQGLLLCWQCHRGEKAQNSGCDYDYSPAVEAKLAAAERNLRVGEPI